VDEVMIFDEYSIRDFEVLTKKLLKIFPEAKASRTRDCIQIDYLEDRGVVILLTPDAVEVRLPTIDWTQGSHGPARSSWLKKRHTLDDSESDIVTSIREALLERQAQYKVCPYCDKEFPPERMAAGACHGCAENHLHIKF
jgi:hypothetical protein